VFVEHGKFRLALSLAPKAFEQSRELAPFLTDHQIRLQQKPRGSRRQVIRLPNGCGDKIEIGKFAFGGVCHLAAKLDEARPDGQAQSYDDAR